MNMQRFGQAYTNKILITSEDRDAIYLQGRTGVSYKILTWLGFDLQV